MIESIVASRAIVLKPAGIAAPRALGYDFDGFGGVALTGERPPCTREDGGSNPLASTI